MEDISPLFAVQAEKALHDNNIQLAIDLCERGLKFFPDYLMGYVLLAEAYQKLGEVAQRDTILEQVKSKFQASHYTQHIERIISNVENPPEIEYKSDENNILENIDGNSSDDKSNSNASISEQFDGTGNNEEINIDELILQTLNENAEEIIDVPEITDILDLETPSETIEETADKEIIEHFTINENEENEPKRELIYYDNDVASELVSESVKLQIDSSTFLAKDLLLIPGIDFIPIRYNYYKVTEFYFNYTMNKNISDSNNISTSWERQLDNFIEFGESVGNFADSQPHIDSNSNNYEVQEYDTNKDVINEIEERTANDYDDEIVPTATLAMIYEKQNKYQEALDIYEKLLLKTPEKADLYRNKIEEITNILFEI